MAASGDISVLTCALYVLFIPFLFQTIGFFTPMWGSNSTCDSIGLLYSCCTGSDNITSCGNTNGRDELDAGALGLQATSLAVMFLTVVFSCCGTIHCKVEDANEMGTCLILGACCSLLYPVPGLFSIIGCIIVATHFSTSELGYSFHLCVTAGCVILIPLLTILVCYAVYKVYKNNKSQDVYPTQHSNTTSQSRIMNERDRNKPKKKRVGNDVKHGTVHPRGKPRLPSKGGVPRVKKSSGEGGVASYKPKKSADGYGAQHASVNPSDGYRGATSTVYPSDGNRREASTVYPSDGYRRAASTVYPSDGNRREASTVYQSDGYRREASTVYPSDGNRRAASTVYPSDGYRRATSTVYPSDSYAGTPSLSSYPGDASSVMSYSDSDGAAPYEQRQTQIDYEAQHATVEHAVAVHDAETGRIFVFLKKISLSRIFASFKHN